MCEVDLCESAICIVVFTKDPMKITTCLNVLALWSIAEASRSGNLRKKNAHAPRKLSTCAGNESSWRLDLTVDDYPWETRWTIKDSDGNKVAYGPADDMNYEKRGTYEDGGCLPAGDYVFTMKDRSGDGLCCEFGEGRYQFRIDDAILAESDDSAFKMLEFPFVVSGNISVDSVEIINPVSSETVETDVPSTPRPSNNPTNQPTAKPSSSPTVVSRKVFISFSFLFIINLPCLLDPCERIISFKDTRYSVSNS